MAWTKTTARRDENHFFFRFGVSYIRDFMVGKITVKPYECHSIFNSLRPSDVIWRQRTGSTLAQVMAFCLTEPTCTVINPILLTYLLTAPSHYLNQCWLIISKVLWHSCEDNFTRDTSAINHQNWPENYFSKFLSNLLGANELIPSNSACQADNKGNLKSKV